MIRAELLEPKFNDFFPRIIRNQGYRRLYSLNEWSVDKWKEDRDKILNNEAFVLRLSESEIKSPTILVTPRSQLSNYIKPTINGSPIPTDHCDSIMPLCDNNVGADFIIVYEDSNLSSQIAAIERINNLMQLAVPKESDLNEKKRHTLVEMNPDGSINGPLSRHDAHQPADNAEYPLHLCGMVILLSGDCIWLCRRSGLKKNPHLLQSQPSYHVEIADSGVNDAQSLCLGAAWRETLEEVGIAANKNNNIEFTPLNGIGEDGKDFIIDQGGQGNDPQNELFFAHVCQFTENEKHRIVTSEETYGGEWVPILIVDEMVQKNPEMFRSAFLKVWKGANQQLKEMAK